MTLRVGLDARCLNTGFIRGMGEYVAAVTGHIQETGVADWVFYGARPDLPFHRPDGCAQAKVALKDVPGDRFKTWEQFALPFQAWRDRRQVLHCTATTVPLWQPIPTVVTIHDTIPWDTGEFIAAGRYRDWLLPRAYRRCAAVITISQHSRDDIVRLWPDLAPKIHVIPHGVGDGFLRQQPGPLPESVRGLGIEAPYLLYLGGTTPRKRLDWTIDLFRSLDRPGISLVICGVPQAAHAECRARVPAEIRDRVIFTPFLAAEDMPGLNQNALAVLYPTLYEGFGFPALNAQAVGTPVLVSNVSSLRELVGPTSIALDPADTAGWRAACEVAITHRLENPAPDLASRAWARHFDWRRSAASHAEVYRIAAAIG